VVITAGAIAEVTPNVAPVDGDERHAIALREFCPAGMET
jgi:hypothetical protein